jgi:hypothetical protein
VSTLLQVGFPGAPTERFLAKSMLEPWRGWRLSEGLWCREGNLIPWVVQTDGEESWVVGIVVGVMSLFFTGYWVVRVDISQPIGACHPCGLIAPTRGDLLLRELEQQSLWLGGTSIVCSRLCKS